MIELPTPETDASCGYALSSHYGRLEGSYLQMDRSGPFVHAEVARKLERERDEAREALKRIDEAILVMKPRHIGQPDMDGRYPCWSVWLPKSGRVERKSLQDALLEFAAQIKEAVK